MAENNGNRETRLNLSLRKLGLNDHKKICLLIHSFKVGFALVLVSLFYLIDPLFDQVGMNAIWAIMTVVVMFEYYAGATLGKGINRGIGTLFGALIGSSVAIFADLIGGIWRPIVIACALLLLSAAAAYLEQLPRIKKRYQYGFRIFILTFNLVAISGVRTENVIEVARDRLANIGIGFTICVFVSFFVYPIWASDDLRLSTATKFRKLADSLQGFLDYIEKPEHEEKTFVEACKFVINSRSKDESMANDARWEPWHGKSGFQYPWEIYLEIGDQLTQLAATILALKSCFPSPNQMLLRKKEEVDETFEALMVSMSWTLRELGDAIGKMEMVEAKNLITPKLQSLKLQFCPITSIQGYNFLLFDIVERVGILGNKVEELGNVANFRVKKQEEV